MTAHSHRTTAVAAVLAGVLLMAGAAVLWAAPTPSVVDGSTGSTAKVTVTAVTSGDVHLAPGGGEQPVVLTVANQSTQAFRISQIRLESQGWPPACGDGYWKVTPSAPLPTVGPHATAHVAVAVSLAADAAATCQALQVSVTAVAEGDWA